jgi:hypothetical protein
MSRWNSGHIKNLEDRGVKVHYSAPPSRDRTVEVVSNGKIETVKIRKAMTHEESILQQNCVKTFQLFYPKLRMRLFSIPNGGYRDSLEAARLVKEGVLPGALDLFLSIPAKNYHGMYIESKTETGILSDCQKDFIKEMMNDYKCVVIISVEQFLKEIKDYLL